MTSVVTAAGTRPAYVYDLSALKTLPPIMYPTTMLNAAVNYREHAVEMAGQQRAARDPAGRSAAGHRAAGHEQRAGHLGTAAERHAVESRTCF